MFSLASGDLPADDSAANEPRCRDPKDGEEGRLCGTDATLDANLKFKFAKSCPRL